jgi:hypothetical protein
MKSLVLAIVLFFGCTGVVDELPDAEMESDRSWAGSGSGSYENLESDTETLESGADADSDEVIDPDADEIVEPDALVEDTETEADAEVDDEQGDASDSGTDEVDGGDSGTDAGTDTGTDTGTDAGQTDSSTDSSKPDTTLPCTCFEESDCCDGCYPINVGASCDDGLFCNGSETCNTEGGCKAGVAPNCSDGISCTSDSCNESTDSCDHDPNDTLCDDGLYCNGADFCSPSEGCRHSGNPCADGGVCNNHCNESNDTCFSPETQTCNDDNVCTRSDTCDGEGNCSGDLFCIYDEGLMWEYSSEEFDAVNYNTARNYCDNLVLGGYSDWRLPMIQELRSIIDYWDPGCQPTDPVKLYFINNCDNRSLPAGYSIDYCCWKPEQNVPTSGLCHGEGTWPSQSSRFFWSSSVAVNEDKQPLGQWAVNYYLGHIGFRLTTDPYSLEYVRCVR